MKRTLATLAVAMLAVAGAACSGEDTDASEDAGDAADAPVVAVSDAWARASASTANAGAVYLTIEASTDDALVAASVDSSVAARAELHETTTDEGEAMDGGSGDGDEGEEMDDGGDGGMTRMREVDEIPLPAGEAVQLEPGGYHIMLLELQEPLEAGSSIDVTLELERGSSRTVSAEVRA